MSTLYSGNSSKTNHFARLRALGLTGDELTTAGANAEADDRGGSLCSSSTLGLLISAMFRYGVGSYLFRPVAVRAVGWGPLRREY